jgi:hypothetical protein
VCCEHRRNGTCVEQMYCLSFLDHFPSKIQKGVSGARSDDTKSLKGVILDWITPRGQSLHPPLSRNIKMDRGFHHERTGALLCPAGMDWSDDKFVVLLPFL